MNYKYQVIIHYDYYPSSFLFEKYEEALELFNKLRGVSDGYAEPLITMCKILEAKGEIPENSEIDWYAMTHQEYEMWQKESEE